MKKMFLLLSLIMWLLPHSVFAQYKAPESIAYDETTGKFFVSWAKSGIITEASLKDGKLLPGKVVARGLMFPRGMVAFEGKLYVTEAPLKDVAVIDEQSGKVIRKLIFPLSKDLNDVVLNEETLYVSDLGGGLIWKMDLKTGKAEKFAGLTKPNGLYIDATTLYVVSFSEAGTIYMFDINNPQKSKRGFSVSKFPYLDGVQYAGGKLIISSWGENYEDGKVFTYDLKSGKTAVLLEGVKGPADILLFNGNLLIPLMSENKTVTKKLNL